MTASLNGGKIADLLTVKVQIETDDMGKVGE
jgi:hypothetical protein